MARRFIYDWIEAQFESEHRVEARTMYGKIIETQIYPARTDLRKLLLETLAKWNAEGWTIETFCDDSPEFFCRKENERLCVSIYSTAPYKGHGGGKSA